jgi:PAS domain-containing protein
MNLLGQFQAWARDLADLSARLRHTGAIQDSVELDEQVHCYRETLRGVPPASEATTSLWKTPNRRSIDLLDRGCIETSVHGIIRRANHAASRLLSFPLPFLTGQPLLVFIAREDQQAFLAEFVSLRRRSPSPHGEWLVRCKPVFSEPYLASVTAISVTDHDQRVVALIWLFSEVRR